MDAKFKIAKARTSLLLRHPFWGSLCLYLQPKEVEFEQTGIDTAATDYKYLFYNPKYIEKLDIREVMFIIAHEVSHCMFDHFGRRGTRNIRKWNISCVDGDTNVLMWNGKVKKIKDIKTNEIVVGFKDNKPYPSIVLASLSRSDDVIYTIELENGSIITCSDDHRFLTAQGEYVSAEKLKSGMYLIICKEHDKMEMDNRRKEISDRKLPLDESKGDSGKIEQNIQSSPCHGEQPSASWKTYEKEVFTDRYPKDTPIKPYTTSISCWVDRWGRNYIYQEVSKILSNSNRDNQYRPIFDGVVSKGISYKESPSSKFERNTIPQSDGIWIWCIQNSTSNRTIPYSKETTVPIGKEVYRNSYEQNIERRIGFEDGCNIQTGREIEFKRCKIQKVERRSERRILYDLVTTTHNYIANGIVVHNCDIAANLILKDAGLTPPAGALIFDEFRMHAEAIYEKLPDPPKIKCPKCGGKKIKGKTIGSKGIMVHVEFECKDCGHKWDAWIPITTEEGENGIEIEGMPGTLDKHLEQKSGKDKGMGDLAKEWKRRVSEVLANSKIRGNMPGWMEELIKEILEPKIDWRVILSQFIIKCYKNNFKWVPPSKRHLHTGLILPSLKGEGIGDVVVTIDTSGSISSNLLKQFISEVQSILNTYEMNLHLIQHDVSVTDYKVFNKGDVIGEIVMRGRGGTSHIEVFDKIKELNITPRVIICLTDSYTVYPNEPPECPILICTPHEHGDLPKWAHTHLIIE
ncbi:MAG: VWA-like domain-containing protein [Nitrososphaerales archaeon]